MRDAGQDSRKLREWKYAKETQDNVGQQQSGSWDTSSSEVPEECEPGEAIASSQPEDIFSGVTSLLLAPEG